MSTIEFSFQDSKYDHLRCKLDPNDIHIYTVPIRLPCKNIACFECIKKKLIDSKLDACICSGNHLINDMNALVIVQELVNEIKLNEEDITRELVEKLLHYSERLEDKFEIRDSRIDTVCDDIRQKIDERVNEIRDQLDKLHRELLNNLDEIKRKVFIELDRHNEQVSIKCNEYEEFACNMEKMLSDYETNKEELQKSIYDCQNKIDDMNRLDETFKKLLGRIKFEPSEWVPDISFLGTFEGFDFDSDLDDANT